MKTLYQNTKNLNILFVEDSKILVYEVSKILEMLFATVTVCKNGKEGLNVYKEKGKFYDIVLTDMTMPYMNGIELIKSIRDLNPYQHIIVLSAQDDSINLRELINLGISSFLLKPIESQQLINRLNKVTKIIKNEKEALKYKKQLISSNRYLEKVISDRTRELEEQLYIDSLTGLKNRTALIENLNLNKFTLMALVDIDRLQFINSLYGIEVGNKIIEEFANLLQDELKFTDYYLYRTSGDEFVICSSDEKSDEFENCIKFISTKVTNLVLSINSIKDEITVDATIGYTLEINLNSHNLLTQSDSALKYAKKNNRSIVSYKESMNALQDMQNIMIWKYKIKTAYENNDIIPVFQPIVNSAGSILKYETLMRLKRGGGRKL